MNTSGPLTVARTFTNVHDAHLAKSVLEAAGIEVTIANEHVVSVNWMYSNLVGGVQALVPDDRVDEARSLLDTHAVLDEAPEHVPAGADADTCVRCGSEEYDSIVPFKGFVVLSWFFLGFPLGWPRRRRVCRQCGLPGERG
jgi:hypothetical protein